MLAGEFTPTAIVIAEGVPDFLVWATKYSDANEDAPVVLGVIAGSWTDALAARVPRSATIYIRTHRDAAGIKYADAICESLARHGVTRRKRPKVTT